MELSGSLSFLVFCLDNRATLTKMERKILSGILGLVVGDALGVPVEFVHGTVLTKTPVVDMQEYGTYYQPKGFWSDDSSMTLCLVESLTSGYDGNNIFEKWLSWVEQGYMTPCGEAFGLGRTTMRALSNYAQGTDLDACGIDNVNYNGNGSLMRTLPIAFYTMYMKKAERFKIVHDISSLTYAHMRSKIACGIYVKLAVELCKGCNKQSAYKRTIRECRSFYRAEKEVQHFSRILDGRLSRLTATNIRSSGYIVDTLEAAIWCLLTTNTYRECVLKAVNLGEDTDTVAAVAGGLAGILYGYNAIPYEWRKCIARREMIEALSLNFAKVCQN